MSVYITWVAAIRSKGYRAVNNPFREGSVDDSTVRAYKTAAHKADIVIAEVGAWSNPISPLEDVRKAAIEKCIQKLDLADRLEARCCVNVSGSRGTGTIGAPHPLNMTDETLEMIVENVGTSENRDIERMTLIRTNENYGIVNEHLVSENIF